MRTRREDHTAATAGAIARAARRQFAKKGFEAASLQEIAREARVTTGAIYHHFADKKALFLAVAEQIEAELLAKAAKAPSRDPWLSLREGFPALIGECARPDVQQIIFLDAPRVIGQEAWREIELKYAYGGMARTIERLTTAGVMRPYPAELIAPTLLAVLAEAARAVAQGSARLEQASELLVGVLDSLRA